MLALTLLACPLEVCAKEAKCRKLFRKKLRQQELLHRTHLKIVDYDTKPIQRAERRDQRIEKYNAKIDYRQERSARYASLCEEGNQIACTKQQSEEAAIQTYLDRILHLQQYYADWLEGHNSKRPILEARVTRYEGRIAKIDRKLAENGC